jgi:hypothetical protein
LNQETRFTIPVALKSGAKNHRPRQAKAFAYHIVYADIYGVMFMLSIDFQDKCGLFLKRVLGVWVLRPLKLRLICTMVEITLS